MTRSETVAGREDREPRFDILTIWPLFSIPAGRSSEFVAIAGCLGSVRVR